MTILNCQNMSIKPNSAWEAPCSRCLHSGPHGWMFADLCWPLQGGGFSPELKAMEAGFWKKNAEMPLSDGFSCGKRQNCDLNLESDDRTWTGTPDISQICCSVGFIVLLTPFISGNESLGLYSIGLHLGNLSNRISSFYFGRINELFSSNIQIRYPTLLCFDWTPIIHQSALGILVILQTMTRYMFLNNTVTLTYLSIVLIQVFLHGIDNLLSHCSVYSDQSVLVTAQCIGWCRAA